VAGAAKHWRAEVGMRTVEDRAKPCGPLGRVRRAGVATNARWPTRKRSATATGRDEIEALAAAIEQAARCSAGALRWSSCHHYRVGAERAVRDSVDEMRREVVSAAELICWELRSPPCARARQRQYRLLAPPEPKQLPASNSIAN